MSPRFWEIFGVDPKTKTNSPSEWQGIIHQQDLEIALCDSHGKHPYQQNVRYRHAEGHWVTVKCRGNVIEWDQNGKAIRMVGTHTDITDLIKIQESLKTSNNELNSFASFVSHDIQAPVRRIEQYLNLILDSSEKTEEDVKRWLEYINKSLSQLNSFTKDLLEYSRIGKKEIKFEKVDLNECLKETIEIFSKELKETSSSIEYSNLHSINANKLLLKQYFQNILGNCIKYSNQNRNLKVHIESHENRDGWTIKVADNGLGISDESKLKVFEMFTQDHELDVPGSGIGLAICKKISQLHKGNIWIEDNPGGGIVVFLKLNTMK